MTGRHARPPTRSLATAAAGAAAAAVATGLLVITQNAGAADATGDSGGAVNAAGGFAPYVDTTLSPAYDLLGAAEATGVKRFNLAFVTSSGGGCAPGWGGGSLEGNPVAAQVADLRAQGGDVRLSFGGAGGTELALACSSAGELAAAYGKAIDALGVTAADFDVEGGALPDAAANARRAEAIATLQRENPELDVSFTLPVMPEGLTQPGVDLLRGAKDAGVDVSAVNIMAMDYGAAYTGDMGQYAIDAATATQAQVKTAFGVDDGAAWNMVAVTPMIGVNDVVQEKFTEEDAAQLTAFAKERNLAWLSMWSATRDKQCPEGPVDRADPTCSGLAQQPYAFTKAFATFG